MSTFQSKSVLPPIKNPAFKQTADVHVEATTPRRDTREADQLVTSLPKGHLKPLRPDRASLTSGVSDARGQAGGHGAHESEPPITRGQVSAGADKEERESAKLSRRPKSRTNVLRTHSPSNGHVERDQSTGYESISHLSEAITTARSSGNFEAVKDFFCRTFESLENIDKTFKTNIISGAKEQLAVEFDYLEYAYESLSHLPKEVEKIVLRSIINCLLKDANGSRPISQLRPLLMLLLCPQFDKTNTYMIFAHVVRQITTIDTNDQRIFTVWLRGIPVALFTRTIRMLLKFIGARLLKKNSDDLPPVDKTVWWIPTAVKVLSMMYAANGMRRPPLVSYIVFYCPFLEYVDMIKEYHGWQNRTSRFSFCQYPFLLSVKTKRYVIQKDSELRMIVEARQSLVKQVQQKTTPRMGMLFLNIKVRRDHIVSDSLNEVAAKKHDLKKKLRVGFIGEPGLDMGGVSKEWFLILLRKIFRQEYGMFSFNSKTRTWWFNPSSIGSEQEFNLVGVLMGLAVYNSMILDVNFPLCCYKKLLSPAVVPFHDVNASVGVARMTLDDLKDVNPELAQGLTELLSYDGDVENDLCQTFQASYMSFGEVKTVSLKAQGDSIAVTNDNKQEYVDLYLDFLLNKSIYTQFAAFYHGFHSVCASNALILLRPEEVEILVCGNPDFDMAALQKVASYDGYKRHDLVVRTFWDIVLDMPTTLKKKLLLFVTGSDRIPVGGMAEMHFRVSRMNGKNVQQMLPTAHTCFNQLCLPPYKSRKDMKQKLLIAVNHGGEGFGIE